MRTNTVQYIALVSAMAHRRIDREDRYAVFNITTDMANEILQMQKLVVDNGLSSVEKHAEEAMWYGEHPASGLVVVTWSVAEIGSAYTPTIAVTTTDIFFVAIEESVWPVDNDRARQHYQTGIRCIGRDKIEL